MKMLKLTMGVITAVASSGAFAQAGDALDGDLAAFTNGGGTLAGSVPVAVMAACEVHNALQILQGMYECVGSRSEFCAPTISSAELTALINGDLLNANGMTNANGDGLRNIYRNSGAILPADAPAGIDVTTGCSGTGANGATIGIHAATGIDNTADSFLHAGDVDGFACGAGSTLARRADGSTTASDAATNAALSAPPNNRANFGLIHATAMDSDAHGDLGFIKLDGVSPSLANHLSGNYNMVANLIGVAALPASETQYGITVGAGAGPSHAIAGTANGCGPLTVGGTAVDLNGGSL